MSTERDEFFKQVLQIWTTAISEVSSKIQPTSQTWSELDHISNVLRPFMGKNRNHAHLPSSGGMDVRSVNISHEPNCLEFGIGERSVWVMKPASLTLEYILESPIDSFLLLELATLEPSGVYDTEEDNLPRPSEELLELAQGEYVSRDIWEQGFLDLDENGHEIPLPDDSRIAIRWLRGKVLIVAKGSLWNGTPGTYDGRHNEMSAIDIRRMITETLNRP